MSVDPLDDPPLDPVEETLFGWDVHCALMHQKYGVDSAKIRIELENGLVISGPIRFEYAKDIFRKRLRPDLPIDRYPQGVEVVVQLPASKVVKVTFPCNE